MKLKSLVILTGCLLGAVSSHTILQAQAANSNEDAVSNTRTLIQEWVDTRSAISTRRSEWNVEKQIIENKIELLESEIETLQSQIDDALSRSNLATDQRADLEQREQELRDALTVVRTQLPEYEAQIEEFVDYFPQPLLNQVDSLVQALPRNRGENTNASAGNRMAVIVGILNEVDKFNKTIRLSRDVREIGEGNRQVRTVYLGLAIAFYADEEGEYAGIGRPADGGWVWTERNDIAPQIAELVGVADGTIKPATFVKVPMEITDIEN